MMILLMTRTKTKYKTIMKITNNQLAVLILGVIMGIWFLNLIA